MAVLLLVAAAVSGVLLGEVVDGVAIAVIVAINAAIAIVEERRADAALAALRALAVPETRVRRAGAVVRIPAAELVSGDVVLLEPGDRVPADLRLITTTGLEVDESVLTGESQAVRKDASAVAAADAGLGGRAGSAYTGTFVVRGTGTGVAVATGAARRWRRSHGRRRPRADRHRCRTIWCPSHGSWRPCRSPLRPPCSCSSWRARASEPRPSNRGSWPLSRSRWQRSPRGWRR
jgi:magnesium-transporting ATPase (P-type)